jgi:hypothetical protein
MCALIKRNKKIWKLIGDERTGIENKKNLSEEVINLKSKEIIKA